MAKQKLTENELRYWRIQAAIQELCYASDEDIEKDSMLKQFLDRVARAVFTYQNTKLEQHAVSAKSELLKTAGIPTLKPRGKR